MVVHDVLFFSDVGDKSINDYQVSTPINVPMLLEMLEGRYADYEYIKSGFLNGFTLGLIPNPSLKSSHKKSNRNVAELKRKLKVELDSGRIIGPFSEKPISNMMTSPIYVIPKPNTTKWRMIFDLSAPKGFSVNQNIPEANRTVKYCTIKSVIDFATSLDSSEVHFAKLDITDAYRLVPMAKSQWKFLGLKLENDYYIDIRLPMGSSSSCQIFQRVSDMFKWVYSTYQSDPHKIFNYLDDFLIVAPSKPACERVLSNVLMLSNGLGVPIAEHKTETATQSLIFLGIGLDAKSQSLYIPESKRLEVMDMIVSFLDNRAPKVKLWQKLLGKLCHLSQVLVAGRTFLSSVYGSLQGILSQDQHLCRRISKEVRLDLLVWYDFLLKISPGKSFKYISAKGANVAMYTDASKTIGFGGWCNNDWFHGIWPDMFWKAKNIAVLELFPILVGLELWKDRFSDKVVNIYTDNKALVPVVEKLYCKDPEIRRILRPIALSCMQNNILLIPVHIKGDENTRADLLSRNRIMHFREMYPSMSRYPTQLPEVLNPIAIRAQLW